MLNFPKELILRDSVLNFSKEIQKLTMLSHATLKSFCRSLVSPHIFINSMFDSSIFFSKPSTFVSSNSINWMSSMTRLSFSIVFSRMSCLKWRSIQNFWWIWAWDTLLDVEIFDGHSGRVCGRTDVPLSGDIASNDLLTSDSIGKSTGIASVLLTLFWWNDMV